MKERRRITIVVGEETRLSFSCLVEFATCVYIVQSKWDVAGMLSKNLHMTVRFHVVLRVRTLIPIYIYIHTLYIRIYTGNEMLGDERMLDVLRARRCSRVTLAEASSSIFAGIYFRYGLSRMYEAIQIFKLSFVRQIFSRYLRKKCNVE